MLKDRYARMMDDYERTVYVLGSVHIYYAQK